VIVTRPASSSDAVFLDRTFLATLREAITSARGGWDEVRERSQFRAQLELGHTEIVQLNGIDVGFVMVTPFADRLELHTLCLIPQYQSKGIGREVTSRILRDAGTRNLDVVVSVLKVNVRARSFYERLGFALVDESEHHYRLHHAPSAVAA
jgi:ribosomal protein S18 acetylase RimI-like enzyme